jgi:hypothetical protein
VPQRLSGTEALRVELTVEQPERLLDRLGELLTQPLGLPDWVCATVVATGDALGLLLLQPLLEPLRLTRGDREPGLLTEELWLTVPEAERGGLREAVPERAPELV